MHVYCLFVPAHSTLAIHSLVCSKVMAPLLDTNHELNWHANMVDAIEQKAAHQRAEGQSTPSRPATSNLLHLKATIMFELMSIMLEFA